MQIGHGIGHVKEDRQAPEIDRLMFFVAIKPEVDRLLVFIAIENINLITPP